MLPPLEAPGEEAEALESSAALFTALTSNIATNRNLHVGVHEVLTEVEKTVPCKNPHSQ